MLISQFGFTNRINSLCHRINGANLKPIKEDNLSTAEAEAQQNFFFDLHLNSFLDSTTITLIREIEKEVHIFSRVSHFAIQGVSNCFGTNHSLLSILY